MRVRAAASRPALPARWRLVDHDERAYADAVRELGLDPRLGPVLAQLERRGHSRATIFGDLKDLEDDSRFDGRPGWELSKAAEAVRAAAKKNGRVYLHGDSDTDGITGTLVVHRALAHYFPADRIRVDMPDPLDHYGFGMKKAEAALAFGADIIVTMDCGTNNTAEVAHVAGRGATVIVLDHHELDHGAPYPQALVVNGKVLHESENLARLSTGGLAWRFSEAVHRAMGVDPGETDHGASLAYVALSTVVDVVPLIGDNRILVREGLRYLNDRRYATPTLVALRSLGGVPYERSTMRSFDLGFRIGPLLNLGKRMESIAPQQIYDLLAYEQKPEKIASEMLRFGLATKERRERTATFKDAAIQFVERYNTPDALVKLAVVRNCPRGIVGLVAQQVASHYGRPAIVLTDHPDPKRTDLWYGSGRCPIPLDFLSMVNATELAVGHGHSQAVGGINVERAKLPQFKERIWALAAEAAAGDADLFAGIEHITAAVPLPAWDTELVTALERLVQPTGKGNEPPQFVAGPVRCTAVTDAGRRAVYTLVESGQECSAAMLGEGRADPAWLGEEVFVRYEVQLFNGAPSIVIRELTRAEAVAKAA